MKIISFNVNGVRAISKKTFFEDMKGLNPDIICLQETKASVDQVKDTVSLARRHRSKPGNGKILAAFEQTRKADKHRQIRQNVPESHISASSSPAIP